METYVQAFERAKRHADFLTAVLSLDEDLWSGNAALLINVTADLARAKSNDDVVKKSVEAMLANEETRRLAIGGFLARPDVIAEDQLLPAIQEELSSDSAFESYASTNEILLILQGIKQESSLKSLRDTIMSWRAGRRQPPVRYMTMLRSTVSLKYRRVHTLRSPRRMKSYCWPSSTLDLRIGRRLRNNWQRCLLMSEERPPHPACRPPSPQFGGEGTK